MREARGNAGAPEDSRGASGAGPDDSLDRLERATRRTTDERDDLLAQNRQLRALLEAIEIERGRLAAVSEFLATMSHELRTPLLAMNGLVELLETEVAGALNAEQKKMLVRMHTAGDHLVEVIDQILDFSRFEGAERGALIVEVDAASLCASVADMLAEGAVARGLALELEMPDVPVVVRTDPCWLRQIVTNLLANAIRYTDRGGVRLELEAGTPADLVVRVCDTGPGINREHLEEIFEPFVQLASERHRRGGAGLGLPICRRLARRLGGDVRVESVPGAGSTFELRLPRGPSS